MAVEGCFSPSPSAASDEEARAILFMYIWTLKEAFVKCRGVGIHAPPGLKGFSMGLKEREGILGQEALNTICSLPLGNSQPAEITLTLHPEGGGSSSEGTLNMGKSSPCSSWKFLLMQPR